MDPLSALAIAAAVVQFAEIGGRLLMKTWSRYREQGQRDAAARKIQSSEEAYLENALKQLASFVRLVRESTDRAVPGSPPGPAEKELLKLCTECESIASDFENILMGIKRRPIKDYAPTDLGVQVKKGSTVPEKDEPVLAGLWTPSKISNTKHRLETVRQSFMTTILLCLWYVEIH